MRIRWQDWANVVLGLWLCISPVLLGHTLDRAATGNAYSLGAAVIVFNLISVRRIIDQGQEIVNLLFGAWMMFAPYTLNFSADQAATGNAVCSGIAIALMGLWLMWDAARADLDSRDP